jgi:hypothetical protein
MLNIVALQLIICHLVLSMARQIVGPIDYFLTEPPQDARHAHLLLQLWLLPSKRQLLLSRQTHGTAARR